LDAKPLRPEDVTDVTGRVHRLLEDFDVVATMPYVALLSRSSGDTLRRNVVTALVATGGRLSSLDYVRKTYVSDAPTKVNEARAAYVRAYQAAKEYIADMRAGLRPRESGPSFGVLGAAIAMERLPASFFSAHLMYMLGHMYEGHAVSRLALEQIAWSYVASTLNDLTDVAQIRTTKAVSKLKRFAPQVGRLYGYLSTKTHIDFSSHGEFFGAESGRCFVVHAEVDWLTSAEVILALADVFGLVWESSQAKYLDDLQAVVLSSDGHIPRADRPFLQTASQCLEDIRNSLCQAEAQGSPT
jgi:hypothetical protein